MRSQVVFSSEVYANKANAERGAAGLRANIAKAAPIRVPRAFVRKSSKPHAKAQPWYFVVAAANYEKQGKGLAASPKPSATMFHCRPV